MKTYGEIVNRLSNTIKSQNKDQRVPKRYILNIFQSKLEHLITQKLHDRSLFREDGLYTLVECVELKKIDRYECDIVEFRSCNTIMKGVKQLPKIINSRFGPAVKNVTNIDYSIEYRFTTPAKYRNSNLREEKSTEQKYYIKDGCPVLPNSSIERINMEILTLEPYLVQEVSGCNQDQCKSYWDYEVKTSDKLTEIAIQETLKELGFGLQIQEDNNPNMSSLQKDKTVQ